MENSFFGAASGGSASLLSPIASFPTLLTHSSSSPADIVNELTINTVGQNTKQNDFQVQYDVTRSFGLRAGFIYGNDVIQPGNTYSAALGDIYYPNTPNRGNCAGQPLNPDGSCTSPACWRPSTLRPLKSIGTRAFSVRGSARARDCTQTSICNTVAPKLDLSHRSHSLF